jgi:hypothetical protein
MNIIFIKQCYAALPSEIEELCAKTIQLHILKTVLFLNSSTEK